MQEGYQPSYHMIKSLKSALGGFCVSLEYRIRYLKIQMVLAIITTAILTGLCEFGYLNGLMDLESIMILQSFVFTSSFYIVSEIYDDYKGTSEVYSELRYGLKNGIPITPGMEQAFCSGMDIVLQVGSTEIKIVNCQMDQEKGLWHSDKNTMWRKKR